MTTQSASETWDPTQWRLYTLLRAAASGLITTRDGGVWFEGAPANFTITTAVSVLNAHGLLMWLPDAHPGTRTALPSIHGDILLRIWDVTVFGPTEHPPVSSKPLHPPCLGDTDDDSVINTEARRLLRDVFNETGGP